MIRNKARSETLVVVPGARLTRTTQPAVNRGGNNSKNKTSKEKTVSEQEYHQQLP